LWALRDALWPAEHRPPSLYACELEATRFAALEARAHKERWHNNARALHGDAFAIEWIEKANVEYKAERNYDGASIMLLNSPYHNGSLEARFLARYTDALMPSGLLVLIVPFYALASCADTLATHYGEVHAYVFPDPEYEVYKQCVVYAVKRPSSLLQPDAALRERIAAWSRDVALLPVLPEVGSAAPVVRVAPSERAGFDEWRLRPADADELLRRFVPWGETDRAGVMRAVSGVLPERASGDLLRRVYPMAVAPAPAYVGTAIAGGIYNGARVDPDDPSSGLPPLLLKGVFDKEHREIDTKVNKKGEVTGIVRIEQPAMRVTVLDLKAHRYVTLVNEEEESGGADVTTMTVGDLIANYSRDLVRVMRENCPLLHDKADPAHVIPLPEYARPLFTAQAHAVMALVKLLGGLGVKPSERRGRGAYLLGEVGCGKSMIMLAVAKALGIKRVLVVCPPHLLDGWAEQVSLALHDARAVVLRDIADVDALAADPDPGMIVAILSNSSAKLGHAYAGVTTPCCPDCGTPIPKPAKATADAADELARTRALCSASRRVPSNATAHAAHMLALAMLPVAPHAPEVSQCLSGHHELRLLKSAMRRQPVAESMAMHMKDGQSSLEQARAWEAVRTGPVLREAISVMAGLCVKTSVSSAYELKRERRTALAGLLFARNDAATTLQVAEWIHRRGKPKDQYDYQANEMRAFAMDLLHLLPHAEALEAAERLSSGADLTRWKDTQRAIVAFKSGDLEEVPAYSYRAPEKKAAPYVGHGLSVNDGMVATWNTYAAGSLACALSALGSLARNGWWRMTSPCGAALYQAVPELRRLPVATWIAKRHRRLFGLLMADEAHEAKRGESARSQAVRRLIRTGMPTIAATGSVMGGYAEDLFAMQWALDPLFREEFPNGYSVREHVNGDGTVTARKYSDAPEFGRRYGFLKELVDVSDSKAPKPMGFGRMSDRIESGVRAIGYAPGVLPLFVLRYLLRIAVVIHKSELDEELPPLREITEYVDVTAEQGKLYGYLEGELTSQIRKDRFNSLLAGCLMGAMTEIPSYLDLCTADVGNIAEGEHVGMYRICYPNSKDLGVHAGECIAAAPGLDPSTILPKEQWLIETVKRELAEGRPCMVFATHRRLLPRLQRILREATGEHVAYLDADKVDADDRIAWIDHNILGKPATVVKRGKVSVEPGKHARVMVVNGEAVQTGINNLIHFCTAIWMENPRHNAIAYRQACGRTHRIGQTREVRIYFPVYRATVQETGHALLMHKVAVSMGTDGLDAASALAAAGVGEGSGLDGYTVGRLLFELRTGERTIKRRRAERNGMAAPASKQA
jgi:hypothetical protein